MNIVKLNNFNIENEGKITIVAGPCQLESRDHAMKMVEKILRITEKLSLNFVYKTSFDKANRSSGSSHRGLGLEKSLKIFEEIKQNFSVAITTDIHNESQPQLVSKFVDIIQVPALLCRQTDILKACAETGKIIKVKKGQFMAPWDMKFVVEKLRNFGAKNIILTERGSSFGYNNLVTDIRSLAIMKDFGVPVIFDATHSVQQPGGLGNVSGGERKYVGLLAKAAVTASIAGVFLEVHDDPDNAPSDGPCMVHLDKLENLLREIKAIDELVKNFQKTEESYILEESSIL